jgi:type VI secretion system secreted protein Hcp
MPVNPHSPNAGGGSVDLFIKITGQKQGWIKGESQDHKHLNEIDVVFYSWNVTQGFDAATGAPTGKRKLAPLTFMMKSQSATPLLLNACTTGERLKDTVLTCRKAGGTQQEYMVWKLTNGAIVSIRTGYLVPTDICPYDEVQMVFQKIELDYSPQKADGSLGGGIVFMDNWFSVA